jgi:hypothetical protein
MVVVEKDIWRLHRQSDPHPTFQHSLNTRTMSVPNSANVPIADDIPTFLDGMPAYLEAGINQAATVAVGVNNMRAKVSKLAEVSDGGSMWTRVFSIDVEEPVERFTQGMVTIKVTGGTGINLAYTVVFKFCTSKSARNLGSITSPYVQFRNDIDRIMREDVYAQLLSAMANPRNKATSSAAAVSGKPVH